jgi:hypothetical protein
MTNGQNPDGPAETWKPKMELVRAVIRFALATRRLDHNARGVEPAPELEGEGESEQEPGRE